MNAIDAVAPWFHILQMCNFSSRGLGLQQLARSMRWPRHRHADAYLAVVIEGRYVEEGDRGRFSVEAGDVLVHRRFEAHRNLIESNRTRVLNLPCVKSLEGMRLLKLDDVDQLVSLAAKDIQAALNFLEEHAKTAVARDVDWPDLLAEALSTEPSLSLAEWSSRHALRPETVSRSFRKAFGITPKLYRAEARTRQAIVAIECGRASLAQIAYDTGFSDQAHMARAVRALTGATATQLRQATT